MSLRKLSKFHLFRGPNNHNKVKKRWRSHHVALSKKVKRLMKKLRRR